MTKKITNEEAIEWFRGSPAYHADHEPYNMAIKALKQTKWIPVSERLPEEGARVFVTQIFGERTVVYCTIFPFEKTKEKYIIAWMPLPEPYKESEDKE